MNSKIHEYLNSWVKRQIDCEIMAKGKAKINNDGWRKLKGYHLETYVNSIDNPFGFLFELKFKNSDIARRLPNINELYRKSLKDREAFFKARQQVGNS